jgi:hypothetical protein
VLSGDTAALPYLARALSRHLEEFPAVGDGLSRSERRLMALAEHQPAKIDQAFPAMHEGETAHYITDLAFFDLANALTTPTPPLLLVSLSRPKGREMPVGTIALTAQGREVLRGGADRVQLCGIDRWLGGVHLEGRGPVWRWHPSEARLIHA